MKAILATISGVGLLIYSTSPTEIPRAAMPLPSNGERMAPMVLNGYSRFPRNIGKAPVYDLNGHRVGRVQKLDADPTGKPTALVIWLPSGRTVTVVASIIGYDEQRNIITAGLTDAQLGLKPAPGPATDHRR